jgi:MFS family permease
VAVSVQVYDLTHSSLAVGLLGLTALVPLVVFGLLGGAVTDSVDRRTLVLLTTSALVVLSVVLAVQAALDLRRLWVLYAVIAVQSAVVALDSPARRTFTPRLLPVALLPAGIALEQVGTTAGLALGPVAAGLLVAGPGYPTAYALDALTFAGTLYAVWTLAPMRPLGDLPAIGLASVVEGLRFLRTRRVLLMTFLVDINAMVFGMPRALFPALSEGPLGGGARTVGLLTSAIAVGSLLAAVSSGWIGRVHRQGLAVVVAIACWGAAIAAFGLVRSIPLALVLLAVAGAADMISSVFRTAILQAATPDALRGRLNGVFIVVVTGGPRLGDLEAGGVAALAGVGFSVVSGGLACIAGVALLAACVPRFLRYDARDPIP